VDCAEVDGVLGEMSEVAIRRGAEGSKALTAKSTWRYAVRFQ
jgi:hypothetical protein